MWRDTSIERMTAAWRDAVQAAAVAARLADEAIEVSSHDDVVPGAARDIAELAEQAAGAAISAAGRARAAAAVFRQVKDAPAPAVRQ